MTSPDRLVIPAREIPAPLSVSAEARAMLARGPVGSPVDWPPLDDAQAWRNTVERMDQGALAIFAGLAQGAGSAAESKPVRDLLVDGVSVYEVGTRTSDDRRRVINVHGGAWVQGGGELCRAGAPARAALFGLPTWSVDYRMPPAHPFPAALDDLETVYGALLAEGEAHDIVVAGDSAGANIAAGFMFRLAQRGLPFPAALILDTPATDLTGSGDTLHTNDGVDTVLVGDFGPPMRLYAGAADLRDPQVSPLFGDLSRGFPPTLLLSGTRDRFLSDTVRFHEALLAAGVSVGIRIFEAQGHGGFMGMAPEDIVRAQAIRDFIEAHTGGTREAASTTSRPSEPRS